MWPPGVGSALLKASDPDGDKLTYWSGPGNAVSGKDNTATFNAAGVRAEATSFPSGRRRARWEGLLQHDGQRLGTDQRDPGQRGFFGPRGTRVDSTPRPSSTCVRMKNDRSCARTSSIPMVPATKRKKGLGEARARAMADYLGTQGVEASRLTLTDGEDNNPVGDNATEAGRKLNRRVEIELSVR